MLTEQQAWEIAERIVAAYPVAEDDKPGSTHWRMADDITRALLAASREGGTMTEQDKMDLWWMRFEYDIAQLRHAYTHLKAGRVTDQPRLADGLLSPVIKSLETIHRRCTISAIRAAMPSPADTDGREGGEG